MLDTNPAVRKLLGATLVLGSVAAASCTRREPVAPAPPATAASRTAQPETRVRLVVAIVVDQLPSWALDRYLPALDAEGALRTAVARGAYFSKSRFGYAGTYTAAGHATVVTGALPRDHGVVANEVWDTKRGRNVSVVDDGVHGVFGEPASAASPSVLALPTVADALESATAGTAKTVALSYKDRAAVLMGGQRPDLALWYDEKRGVFTTSTYYGASVPAWLTRWHSDHPVTQRLAKWVPEDPRALEAILGPDTSEGKGDWKGLGTNFPHDPRAGGEPASAFRATPAALDYLLDLARESIEALELGKDDVPDLLLISVSNTDYVGHVFGAESWEYLDNLRRADRALGRFLRELERRTSIRALVTSDHGVAALPERSRAAGRPALRVSVSEVAKILNQKMPVAGGGTPTIAAYTEPFLYFSEAARSAPDFEELMRTAIREVTALEGILAAYSVSELISGRVPRGATTELARASVMAGRGGDVFVVLREHSFVDPRMPGGSGTSHGSPWSYDQLVPVLFFGAGVAPRIQHAEVDTRQIAPTLAALLGIAPPQGAGAPALF